MFHEDPQDILAKNHIKQIPLRKNTPGNNIADCKKWKRTGHIIRMKAEAIPTI